jgi:hypothetical protein
LLGKVPAKTCFALEKLVNVLNTGDFMIGTPVDSPDIDEDENEEVFQTFMENADDEDDHLGTTSVHSLRVGQLRKALNAILSSVKEKGSIPEFKLHEIISEKFSDFQILAVRYGQKQRFTEDVEKQIQEARLHANISVALACVLKTEDKYTAADISTRKQTGYPVLLSRKAGNICYTTSNPDFPAPYRTIIYNTFQHVKKKLDTKLRVKMDSSQESVENILQECIHGNISAFSDVLDDISCNSIDLRLEFYFQLGKNDSFTILKQGILKYYMEKVELVSAPLKNVIAAFGRQLSYIDFISNVSLGSSFSSIYLLLNYYEMLVTSLFCNLKLGVSCKKYDRGFGLPRELFNYPHPSLTSAVIKNLSSKALVNLFHKNIKKNQVFLGCFIVKFAEELVRNGLKISNFHGCPELVLSAAHGLSSQGETRSQAVHVTLEEFLGSVADAKVALSVFARLLINILEQDTYSFRFLTSLLSKNKLEFKNRSQIYIYLPSSLGLNAISSSSYSLSAAKRKLNEAFIFQSKSKVEEFDSQAFELFMRDSIVEAEKLLPGNISSQEFLKNIPVDIFIKILKVGHICCDKASEVREVGLFPFFSSFQRVIRVSAIILATYSFYSKRIAKNKVPSLLARARDNLSLEIKKNGLPDCRTAHWLKDSCFFRYAGTEDKERFDIISALAPDELEILEKPDSYFMDEPKLDLTEVDNFIVACNQMRRRNREGENVSENQYESNNIVEEAAQMDTVPLQAYFQSEDDYPLPASSDLEDKFLEELMKNPIVESNRQFLHDSGLLSLEELTTLGEKSFCSLLMKRAQWDKEEAEFLTRKVFSVVKKIKE